MLCFTLHDDDDDFNVYDDGDGSCDDDDGGDCDDDDDDNPSQNGQMIKGNGLFCFEEVNRRCVL